MIQPVKHDWREVLGKVRIAYAAQYGIPLTDYKLARILTSLLGRTIQHRTIRDIDAGAIPKWDIGQALLSMQSGENTIVPRESALTSA